MWNFARLASLCTNLLLCSSRCLHYDRICRRTKSRISLGTLDCFNTAPNLADRKLLNCCRSYKAKLRSFYFSFSPQNSSKNGYIKLNGFSWHRNPVAQSTDGVRGKLGFQEGRHAWELCWEGPLGTVAMVGVATENAPLQAPGYIPLLGNDDQG